MMETLTEGTRITYRYPSMTDGCYRRIYVHGKFIRMVERRRTPHGSPIGHQRCIVRLDGYNYPSYIQFRQVTLEKYAPAIEVQ